MQLDKPPRDIIIAKDDREKYAWLSTKFDLDVKEIFLLAMKLGFFYGLKDKPKSPRQSIAQFSTLSDEAIKDMITIAYAEFEDDDQIFNGKIVVSTCEEYATGGITKLYGSFAGANKEDVKIIEDIVDDLANEIK